LCDLLGLREVQAPESSAEQALIKLKRPVSAPSSPLPQPFQQVSNLPEALSLSLRGGAARVLQSLPRQLRKRLQLPTSPSGRKFYRSEVT
jgi:hypothetical protein